MTSPEDDARHIKGDYSCPRKPPEKEDLEIQGNASALTLIKYFAKCSNTKTSRQGSKAAAQMEEEAVNAAKIPRHKVAP